MPNWPFFNRNPVAWSEPPSSAEEMHSLVAGESNKDK